ncbi:MAG: NADP-dependent oxidoreductase [Allosphingosinicella sp.]|uniref:NADP-dependent oxidoreductase n=1 Tax=Allosphingosinicella sp. TaxID=2823234 RepID=UPI003930028D
MTTARAWTLKQRPQGMPTHADFELREQELAPLQDGEVRVRNEWLSVDPYMRGRMNDVKSYVPPFQLGEPMEGGAVGRVVESRSHALQEGDLVQHMLGWRDVSTGPAGAFNKLPALGVPDQQWLGNLGLTGGTAYWGLLDAAEAKQGETVFVSAAAGAVGSAVVQIAKAKGMKVIGSAGGPEKCAWVKELGADAVIDYKAGPVLKGLAGALKEIGEGGIDVYFDNVGGDHLDAALATARNRARFSICGLIESYNSSEPTALRYLARVIAARITIRGFLFPDYMGRMSEFYAEMGPWVASGTITSRETVHDGIDAMPDAFIGLFTGSNTGKMLVRL